MGVYVYKHSENKLINVGGGSGDNIPVYTTEEYEQIKDTIPEGTKFIISDDTDESDNVINDKKVSGTTTWSSEKINANLGEKADKTELSKIENSGIADNVLIKNSIGRNMSWSELEKAKTVTYFTNWDDSTHFPNLYGSGVLIPGLDTNNKYISYRDNNNTEYINVKTVNGWSGWKEFATMDKATRFPDYTNPLTISSVTWTAPVDCYLELIVIVDSTGGTLYIDGIDVITQFSDGTKTYKTFHGYVKKGSVVTGDQIGSLDGRVKAYPLI